MDLATIIGMAGGTMALIFSVLTSGGSLWGIFDIPSLIFVIGGSFFALFNGASIAQVLGMCTSIGRAFRTFDFGSENIIRTLVQLAEKARREGILALEEGIEEMSDDFMKTGIRLVVDGIDGAVIRTIMENEMSQCEGRHMNVISMLSFWGSVGPGFGMMGTVIGLIGMLRNLEDKSSLGPNMAVALVTTLYGSLMVNWLLSPWSQKLGRQNSDEMATKEIIIEGVLSIQAGDNPRILAQKLLTYLPPAKQAKLSKELLNE
ncbi:MAG: motility protein A [Spirochaetaceae bacterium]|jgi:chemotaxis protein MotA|nr:motility protein A [Spirochaetaceae bacterium]